MAAFQRPAHLRFSHPPKSARYASGAGVRENWWYDAAKAAKLEQAK